MKRHHRRREATPVAHAKRVCIDGEERTALPSKQAR
jgi:hypothetical protein